MWSLVISSTLSIDNMKKKFYKKLWVSEALKIILKSGLLCSLVLITVQIGTIQHTNI